MKNGKVILTTIILITITLTCYASISLLGKWGISSNENAVFEINADSIYYVDEMTQYKYSTIGDSLFIYLNTNSVLRNKYLLGDDKLTISHDNASVKYIRMNFGRSPIVGTCKIQSGFTHTSSRIENLVTYGTFVLAFCPNSSMNVGTSYLVAKISQDFCPDSDQSINYSENGRNWNIKIKSSGDVYFKIISGKNLNSGNEVRFASFKYSLF